MWNNGTEFQTYLHFPHYVVPESSLTPRNTTSGEAFRGLQQQERAGKASSAKSIYSWMEANIVGWMPSPNISDARIQGNKRMDPLLC